MKRWALDNMWKGGLAYWVVEVHDSVAGLVPGMHFWDDEED